MECRHSAQSLATVGGGLSRAGGDSGTRGAGATSGSHPPAGLLAALLWGGPRRRRAAVAAPASCRGTPETAGRVRAACVTPVRLGAPRKWPGEGTAPARLRLGRKASRAAVTGCGLAVRGSLHR